MANCSSSGLKLPSLASPSTWSNGGRRPVRDGAPFCVTTSLTLPPCTVCCPRPSASICSMPSSSCGSIVGTLPGSTSQPIRQPSGLHVSLGWGSALHDPKQRSDLRYRRHRPIAHYGYSRQAHCTSLTLAEQRCRAVDRIKQRCAGPSPGSVIRRHKFTRPPRRTSSPLRSGLSFRCTQDRPRARYSTPEYPGFEAALLHSVSLRRTRLPVGERQRQVRVNAYGWELQLHDGANGRPPKLRYCRRLYPHSTRLF